MSPPRNHPVWTLVLCVALAACSSNNQGGDTGVPDGGNNTMDATHNGNDVTLPDGYTQLPDGAIVDQDGNVVQLDSGNGGLDGTGGPDGTVSDVPGDGPVIIGNMIYCGGEPCECSDGMDNDGDGVEDALDPECVSPFDDDESSFATGIPGDNMGSNAATECFFDGNSGPGNDHECVIPNGCDCRGCCEFDINRNGTREKVSIRDVACHTVTPTTTANVEGGPCTPSGDGGQGSCNAGLNCLADGDGRTFFCAPCVHCRFTTEDDPNSMCMVNECMDGEVCIGDPPTPPMPDGGTSDVTTPPPDAPGVDAEPVDAPEPPPQCPTDLTPCVNHDDCGVVGPSFFCVTGCCQDLG